MEDVKEKQVMNDEQLEEAIAKAITEGIQSNLAEAVGTQIDAKIKELNLDKIDRKWGAFPGMSDEDIATTTKKERVAQFVKSVFSKDTEAIIKLTGVTEKGMTEGLDSAGGFLVPEDFRSEIARIANDYGYVRRFARHLPMKRDSLPIPVEGSSVTTFWPGEAGNAPESNPTFDQPKLRAHTHTGLSTMSNELLADADVDILDYLMEIFAEAMAGEEDEQGFNGVGTPFTGILTHSQVQVVTMATGNTAFANVDLDDLIDLRTQVKASVLSQSAYFMHREVWGIVQKITENSQHILSFQNPLVIAKGPGVKVLQPAGFIQGWPVYLSDKLPDLNASAISTKFIIFGSMGKGVFFGDRKQMALDISKEASISGTSMFQTNQSAVRLLERVAITIGLPEALVSLETSAS